MIRFLKSLVAVIFIVSLLFYPAKASQYTDSEKVFKEKIASPAKTYVVFGADWCGPCNKLKDLLKQAGISHKIIFLDASKIWVAKILMDLHYQMIPYTAVYQNGKHTGVIRVGMNDSLIFLLANVKPY
tara:strand:+ start:624 stop:1007 length:384 start_codon:yes stop_codon:yes gene_type:complete